MADQIGCKRWQSIKLIIRVAILDRYILALNKTGCVQALTDRVVVMRKLSDTAVSHSPFCRTSKAEKESRRPTVAVCAP
jgi:hypothetical protein